MQAILALDDGTVVRGEGFGHPGIALGELVFATSFTGYEEMLTDPSYKGQILMLTYPLIGNYGVSGDRFQSDGIQVEGFVVRERFDSHFHYRSKRSIEEFLRDERIPGICEVDTRMLTRRIREFGTMKACIVYDVGIDFGREDWRDDVEAYIELARSQPDISSIDLISKVTCERPYMIRGSADAGRIALIDCGVKRGILRSLSRRNFEIFVFPAHSSISSVESCEPDALLVSNGPGDPKIARNVMEIVRHFTGKIPIFGICLGHQITALALGCNTFKMKFGHRGANQPVKDVKRGKVFITSQNHGFAVDENSADGIVELTQFNANDGTVEGFEEEYLGIYCVQYHPEANPGPEDTEKIFFDNILRTIERWK